MNFLRLNFLAVMLCSLTIGTHGRQNKSEDKVYEASEVTKKVEVYERPAPEFPVESRKCGNGTWKVKIKAVLLKSGQVGDIKVLKKATCEGLAESAVRAAGLIKFKPARIGGEEVSQFHVVEYNFRLY